MKKKVEKMRRESFIYICIIEVRVTEKMRRKIKVEKMRRGSERSGWGCDRRGGGKVEKTRRGSE